MFPDCALPGCRNPVTEPGDVCADCHHAFGPILQPGVRITVEQIAERDAQVRAAYLRQRAS
jgi:hypothetical protein